MRKVLCFIVILFLFIITGCGNNTGGNNTGDNKFSVLSCTKIMDKENIYIIMDNETKVQYIVWNDNGGLSLTEIKGICPRYDSNGKLYIGK